VFNSDVGRRHFAFHVGGAIRGKDEYFAIQDLPNFWDLVAKAKEVIENPQELGKTGGNAAAKAAKEQTSTKGKTKN